MKIIIIFFITQILCSQTINIKYDYISMKGHLKNEVFLNVNSDKSQFICDFKSKKFKIDYMEGEQNPKYFVNNFYFTDKIFKENVKYKGYVFYSTWKLDYNWVITEEKDEILGYNVVKAYTETNSRAGKLYAWFSTDLPFSTGPFRFGGLPGLILKISYEKINTSIVATQITENKNFNFLEINENGIYLSKEEIIQHDEDVFNRKINEKK